MNLFLLCVNQNDERSVLPMSSGDASSFLRERMGSWLCFSPSAVISLKRRAEWRELWVIDSAFILQVFGGFEVIESLGMGDSSKMSMWCPSGVRRAPPLCVCARALAGMHVSSLAGGETEGTGSMFSNTCYSCGQSFLLTHDISPRLISFSCRGRQDQTNVVWNSGGGTRRRRRGGSGVGGCLLERWSEGWKRRERESVMQSALCHVVTWYSGGRCYSINQQSFQQLLLFTAWWLFCRGGGGALFLHDASEYPCKE